MKNPLRIMLLIVSITCLEGCNSPKIRDLDQHSIFLTLETDESGRRYVVESESWCQSRKYRHSKEFIGPISEPKKHDLSDCDQIIGYKGSPDYIDLNQFMEDVRVEIIKDKLIQAAKFSR